MKYFLYGSLIGMILGLMILCSTNLGTTVYASSDKTCTCDNAVINRDNETTEGQTREDERVHESESSKYKKAYEHLSEKHEMAFFVMLCIMIGVFLFIGGLLAYVNDDSTLLIGFIQCAIMAAFVLAIVAIGILL